MHVDKKKRICPVCDTQFTLPRATRGKPPIYCSAACRSTPTRERNCPLCGITFNLAPGRSLNETYCCTEHRDEFKHSNRLRFTETCSLTSCDEPTRPAQHFCCDDHLLQWKCSQDELHEHDKGYGLCQTCDNPVLWDREKLRKPQKFCSPECRQSTYVEVDPNRKLKAQISEMRGWNTPSRVLEAKVTGLAAGPFGAGRTNPEDRMAWNELPESLAQNHAEDGWNEKDWSTARLPYSPMLVRKMMRIPYSGDRELSHIEFVMAGPPNRKPSKLPELSWPYDEDVYGSEP